MSTDWTENSPDERGATPRPRARQREALFPAVPPSRAPAIAAERREALKSGDAAGTDPGLAALLQPAGASVGGHEADAESCPVASSERPPLHPAWPAPDRPEPALVPAGHAAESARSSATPLLRAGCSAANVIALTALRRRVQQGEVTEMPLQPERLAFARWLLEQGRLKR